MKHADTLTPTETLYESRLFEALHRLNPQLRIFRQQRIRCKGCGSTKHKTGKLWITDFYIWPALIVEVVGHAVDADRTNCLNSRMSSVINIANGELREMDSALNVARYVLLWHDMERTYRTLMRDYQVPRVIVGAFRDRVIALGRTIQLREG